MQNLDSGEKDPVLINNLALSAAGVDNCVVELDSEEPPVADGAALVFLDLLEKAGVKTQDEERDVIAIDRVLRVDDGDRFILIMPYDGFRISFTSLNPHPLAGTQYTDVDVTPGAYRKEIAPARTIAYEGEVEALRKAGLGLGGTLETVIVYDENGVSTDAYDHAVTGLQEYYLGNPTQSDIIEP